MTLAVCSSVLAGMSGCTRVAEQSKESPQAAAPVAAPSTGETPVAVAPAADQTPAKRTLAEILEGVDDGVVYITAKDALRRDIGFGSGFVIDRSGLVATNYHVLESAVTATVQLRNGDNLQIAGVRAWDADHDLAIVQLQNPPETLEAFELALPRDLVQGEELVAIGHPSGFKYTVTTGIVSAVRTAAELPEEYRHTLGSDENTLWVQTSAAISSGSSGGPLMTLDGAVVAVNTWVGAGQNLSFAVHVKHLLDLRSKLDAELRPLPMPGSGVLTEPEIAGIYEKNQSELMQVYQDARRQSSPERAQQIVLENYPVPRYAEKLLDIAERNRGTNKGFEALYAVGAISAKGNGKLTRFRLRAARELLQDYVEFPRVGDALRQLRMTHAAEIFELLEAVRARHSDPNHRALATMCLADSLSADPLGSILYAPEIERLIATTLEQYPQARWGRSNWPAEQANKRLFAFRHLTAGRRPPEIVGQQADGRPLRLSEFQGKVVVLDFWADWCPYCREMYRPTRELVDRLKEQPFAFLGINADPPQTVQQLIDEKVVTWPNWVDGPEGPIARDWQVDTYPTTFVIDDQGFIRYRDLRGPILEQIVAAMLGARSLTLPRDLLPAGSEWKYEDGEADLGVAWRAPDFHDSAWSGGSAPLGYGMERLATVVRQSTRPTLYLRRSFEVPDPAKVQDLLLEVWYDDAVAIFLNGHRIASEHLPDAFTASTLAMEPVVHHGLNQSTIPVDPGLLRTGRNVLAVEVHQAQPAGVDLRFDLAVSANGLPLIQRAVVGDDPFARQHAMLLLSELGRVPEDCVAPLKQVVRDEAPLLQLAAATALLKSHPAVESELKIPRTADADLLALRQAAAANIRTHVWRTLRKPGRPHSAYRDADVVLTATQLLDPNLPPGVRPLAQLRMGRTAEALKTAGSFLRFQHHPVELACVCLARSATGDFAAAQRALDQLDEILNKPEYLELEEINDLLKECEAAVAEAPADALSVLN